MKALILAGGRGSRLRPLTATRSKQLLPVANRPILHWVIDRVVAAGLEDILIVVGESGDEIRRSVGTGAPWGARIEYVDQPGPLGLAHAVACAQNALGQEPFLLHLGDNLIEEPLAPLVRSFAAEAADALLLLARVDDPQRFGVVEVDGARVVRLEEKPEEPRSDLALVGVYIFSNKIHSVIQSLTPSRRGELEITDAIQGLVDAGSVVAHRQVHGWWKDTGKPEDLLDANRQLLARLSARGEVGPGCRVRGVVHLEDGAVVEDCEIEGPVVIGAAARIRGSRIGPHLSVGACSVIDGADVADSILQRGVRIRGPVPPIRRSLLGEGVRVEPWESELRIVAGDSSSVGGVTKSPGQP